MPIAFAPSNTELTVRSVLAEEKTKKHLREMGIAAGGKITILSSSGGSVIVAVKEGRLCLDKSVANKIIVA